MRLVTCLLGLFFVNSLVCRGQFDDLISKVLSKHELAAVERKFVEDIAIEVGVNSTNLSYFVFNEIGDANFGNVNAIVLGHSVYFGSRVFDVYTPEMLRFIIAHELGHYQLGHLSKRAHRALAVLAMNILFQYTLYQKTYSRDHKIRSVAVGVTGQAMISVLLNIIQSYLARQEEFEADRFAIRALGCHGAALEWITFLKPYVKQPLLGDLFSTHPSLDKRGVAIEKLKTEAAASLRIAA